MTWNLTFILSYQPLHFHTILNNLFRKYACPEGKILSEWPPETYIVLNKNLA